MNITINPSKLKLGPGEKGVFEVSVELSKDIEAAEVKQYENYGVVKGGMYNIYFILKFSGKEKSRKEEYRLKVWVLPSNIRVLGWSIVKD